MGSGRALWFGGAGFSGAAELLRVRERPLVPWGVAAVLRRGAGRRGPALRCGFAAFSRMAGGGGGALRRGPGRQADGGSGSQGAAILFGAGPGYLPGGVAPVPVAGGRHYAAPARITMGGRRLGLGRPRARLIGCLTDMVCCRAAVFVGAGRVWAFSVQAGANGKATLRRRAGWSGRFPFRLARVERRRSGAARGGRGCRSAKRRKLL